VVGVGVSVDMWLVMLDGFLEPPHHLLGRSSGVGVGVRVRVSMDMWLVVLNDMLKSSDNSLGSSRGVGVDMYMFVHMDVLVNMWLSVYMWSLVDMVVDVNMMMNMDMVVHMGMLVDMWLVTMWDLGMWLIMKSLVSSLLLESPHHSSGTLEMLLVGTGWSLVLGLVLKLLDDLLSRLMMVSRGTVLVNMGGNMVDMWFSMLANMLKLSNHSLGGTGSV